MAIDISELTTWIETDEGKGWLEGQKKPLIDKRDELLEALRKANGAGAAAVQRAADFEKMLDEERSATRKILVEDRLSRLLEEKRVPALIRSNVMDAILNANDVQLEANGRERKAVVMTKGEGGKPLALPLEDWVKNVWAMSDEAKGVMMGTRASGGGSRGPGPSLDKPESISLSQFEGMDAAARMDFIRHGGAIV